ncbi:MAG: membrane protein insertase YidC [Alphaproteobacteria bacterium]
MEQRNLILAIVASLIILLGWQFLFVEPQERQRQAQLERQQQREQAVQTPAPEGLDPSLPAPETAPGIPGAVRARPEVLAEAERVVIRSPQLRGSVNLVGGRIDDLVLTRYRETVNPASPEIVLLSPSGAVDPYYAEFGWIDADNKTYGVRGARWTTQGKSLSPGVPLEMSWQSEAGLSFTRTIEVDDNFMFTVTQRVENLGDEAVQLYPFGRIIRFNTPDTLGFYILHEGPIGVLDGTLKEVDYDDLRDDGPVVTETTGGWIGITDKYWLTALVPDQKEAATTRFTHTSANGTDRYQADFRGEAKRLEPGASVEVTNRLFAGAKRVQILDTYRDRFGIDRFDMAIDFGWFFFLTKPLLGVLIFFAEALGNFGLSILALTVIIKLIFFPLANKSYKSMSRMKALQPKITEIKENFGEDRQKMQQEMMALYKREKVNPVSGCLPMVIQIPVFFALYKVLFVSIEMRQAPFYGWIKDLSLQDPTSVFNLFGLIPWDPPSFLILGAWPLIMGISMFLQQKLNPAPADPVQAKVFLLMPVVFTIFLARFPAGLVIYWAWNNILSMAQQYVIMRRMGVAIGGGKTA